MSGLLGIWAFVWALLVVLWSSNGARAGTGPGDRPAAPLGAGIEPGPAAPGAAPGTASPQSGGNPRSRRDSVPRLGSGGSPGSERGAVRDGGSGREQARLRARVVEEDTEERQKDPQVSGLQRVGGVDLSYIEGHGAVPAPPWLCSATRLWRYRPGRAGQLSACASSPCQNGGTCVNDRQSFVCACRHPFGGVNCSVKLVKDNSLSVDFSKGSYRYAPMVAFFASHTYGMTTPGPIRFNNLDVNYGASFAPATGKFHVPYLGVYVFEWTIESFSPRASGYLVIDGVDKLTFQAENMNNSKYTFDRVITGNALLELNYGQEVWLRLATGSIPAKYPPVTTFSGYLLYRT
uniref:multimerin-1-like n=1 Tax=Agelaius phoeniceus TaxID=39638 RepID=UPI0023EBF1C6|nr:multimerin-1-like [Agelaius phoeniceus]